ncbi:MAG: Fe(2+)-trafficking protein, partial [Gammaproteobacteria bacterium]|nr:Fe(2+)-trafficking protein [Gammaproteobacteria bacterium]
MSSECPAQSCNYSKTWNNIMSRTVFCQKLQKELPGLNTPTYP